MQSRIKNRKRSNGGNRDKKAVPIKLHNGKSKAQLQMSVDDEDIYSEDEEDAEENIEAEDEDEGDIDETVEQKRIRLAKEYLRNVEGTREYEEDGDSDEDDLYQSTSERLTRDRLDAQGKLFRNIAESIDVPKIQSSIRYLSGHKGPITGVAVSSDSTTAYSCSKDNSLISWDIETGARTFLKPLWSRQTSSSSSSSSTQSHEGELLAVACSTDNKYIATGSRDRLIRIYDTRSSGAIHTLQGHRGAVTCLAFQKDSASLFSGSDDRCIKQWDMNEMGYLETLFGHQEPINAIDCWIKEQPISVSSDRTIRVFKVPQQSHLVFRGHKSIVDAVQIMSESSYITGGQDGMLCLWKETSKKPIASVINSHGNEHGVPRWVTSIASLKMTDLATSGSHDGHLRFWQARADSSTLRQVAEIPINGFINSIAMSSKLIVAGSGNEHRLGRWWRLAGNNNKLVLATLALSSE